MAPSRRREKTTPPDAQSHGIFLRRVDFDDPEPAPGYPYDLRAVQQIETIRFGQVTILTGDNGTGKSTIIEAIAIAAGFNPEGGSRNLRFSTYATHSDLYTKIRLVWATRPRWGWFLRAETFYGMATRIVTDDHPTEGVAAIFGPLHDESHGESLLDIILSRCTHQGLYIFDEPESALSAQGQLTLLRVMHEACRRNAQFIIATHSPLLLAYPGATLLHLDEDGLHLLSYDELPAVQLWRRFLQHPTSVFDQLFADDDWEQ